MEKLKAKLKEMPSSGSCITYKFAKLCFICSASIPVTTSQCMKALKRKKC